MDQRTHVNGRHRVLGFVAIMERTENLRGLQNTLRLEPLCYETGSNILASTVGLVPCLVEAWAEWKDGVVTSVTIGPMAKSE